MPLLLKGSINAEQGSFPVAAPPLCWPEHSGSLCEPSGENLEAPAESWARHHLDTGAHTHDHTSVITLAEKVADLPFQDIYDVDNLQL
jgi:hypothetical protein